jgi:hypothetical protein
MNANTFHKARIGGHGRLVDQLMVAAVLAFGLAFGVGIAPAAADDLAPPNIQSVRVDGTVLYVTFSLANTDDLEGLWINVRERDNPDRLIFSAQAGDELPLRPIPDPYRAVTRQMDGVPPGVPVCVTLELYRDPSRFMDFRDGKSGPSNSVCTDPAVTKAAPDLTVTVRGNESLTAGQREQHAQSGVFYFVKISNSGGGDATGVVVDMQTSGTAELAADQSLPTNSWTAAGFTCTPPTATAWRCSGGTIKTGESREQMLLVKFTRPAQGHIHVGVSGPGESQTGNNAHAMNVWAS